MAPGQTPRSRGDERPRLTIHAHRVMQEIRFQTEDVTIQSMDGTDAEIAALSVDESELRDAFDLNPESADDGTRVVPLRRNLAGTTNYEELTDDGETVTFRMTDDQYHDLRTRLATML